MGIEWKGLTHFTHHLLNQNADADDSGHSSSGHLAFPTLTAFTDSSLAEERPSQSMKASGLHKFGFKTGWNYDT